VTTASGGRRTGALPRHLAQLESEAIHILREGVAEARKPVLLFSGGKDSTVLAALAARAFHPSPPPLPLLHIDSTWEFQEILEFRDRFAERYGFDLIVERNEEGLGAGIGPFTHDPAIYTEIMRTRPLTEAIARHRFDVIFGGARRDEDPARAKERIFSLRLSGQRWDPRSQRPELWRTFNVRLGREETLRVFPLSNWTEADIWAYADCRGLELAPLYFAASRPGGNCDGQLLVVHDTRFPARPGEVPVATTVRFRTVGCWPVTGAVPSEAVTLEAVIQELAASRRSERQGRKMDGDGGSLERQKREGYF